MNETQLIFIGVVMLVVIAFTVLTHAFDSGNINGTKAKTVGDGQHGTARWATKRELSQTFLSLPFEPEKWRKGLNLLRTAFHV